MFRRKKTVCIAAGLTAGIGILILALCLFYRNAPFGFGRSVSESEQQQRLHLIHNAEGWLSCQEADGSHQPIIDLYNSQEILPMAYQVQYTDSWCCAFVTAVAMQSGLTDVIPPECGCERQINLFQAMGRWQERDTYLPLPGDIIYYAWDEATLGDCTGWADHVGIVVGTCWPLVKVIEGNKDDRVDYRITTIWDPTIRGYGLPEYR